MSCLTADRSKLECSFKPRAVVPGSISVFCLLLYTSVARTQQPTLGPHYDTAAHVIGPRSVNKPYLSLSAGQHAWTQRLVVT